MTKTNKTSKTNKSLEATRLLLKKRRKALSLTQINKALSAAGIKQVTEKDLDENFKHVCAGPEPKWLLGGTPAVGTKQKAQAKKPACKKHACNDKQNQKCKLPPNVSGACKIECTKGFDIKEYNHRAMMANAIMEKPEAEENPDAFVFVVGDGCWPETYHGIEVISNNDFAGVMLIPRSFVYALK